MRIKAIIAVAALTLAVATGAFAMDKNHDMKEMDHGAMDKAAMDKGAMDKGSMDHGAMDHSGHVGEMIHESKVGMYSVAYHLIDAMAKMKEMEGDHSKHMGQMKSHHLMSYFKGHGGKVATGGKVGYLVVGPDGEKQKAMAMEMKGGYGADVELKAKGKYTIKTKAVFGDETVIDEFTHEVK